MTRNEYVLKLRDISSQWGKDVKELSARLLDREDFGVWPGSVGRHHNERKGLSRHTLEVVELALSVIESLKLPCDKVVVFLAALYHDSGKLHDIVKLTDDLWTSGEHKRLIHHISRSGIIWTRAVQNYPELEAKYHDKVLHCLLAHHGDRLYGSPVAPKSMEAWLVHLCDTLSARMDDCDKVDLLEIKRSGQA